MKELKYYRTTAECILQQKPPHFDEKRKKEEEYLEQYHRCKTQYEFYQKKMETFGIAKNTEVSEEWIASNNDQVAFRKSFVFLLIVT